MKRMLDDLRKLASSALSKIVRAARAYNNFLISLAAWLLQPTHLAALMLIAGAAAIGAGLWGWLGWQAAVVFWGVCAMAAGLEEVLDRGQ